MKDAIVKTTDVPEPVGLREIFRLHTKAKRLLAESALGYLFLAPSLVLFGIFLFYPLIKTVYLSFQLTNPRGKVVGYAGWDNFTELFHSGTFLQSLAVTGKFTLLTVPASILLALALAALTAGTRRGMKPLRWIFSMPVAISAGTGAVIWMQLFHPTTGMLNYLLGRVGLPAVAWLTDPSAALLSVSLMTVWMNLGFAYIILLGGINGLPAEIYESARMDGAGPLRTFVRITLPLLSPTLFFLTIVSVISAFQSFAQIHILTKGGPVHTTGVMVYAIYEEAFINYRFGSGSAQALVLFVLILALTVVQYKFLEKKVHYQ